MRAFAAVCAALLLAGAAHAQSQDLVDAAREGDEAAALALVESGADVNAAEPNGSTALLYAAHFDLPELAEALLDEGADPDAANTFGATPIGEAATVGSAGIISLLLDAGVGPDSANPEGQTPLMAVARTGRVDAARALIEAGADVNATEDWGGQTALMWAAAQGHPDMVALLVEAGADVDMKGKARNWQRRITVEPRQKIMNDAGLSALHYAARENCLECVRVLVEAGADIDIEDPDRVTPLNLALMNLHFDLAKYLIEAGADVDKWDFAGRTPLYNSVDMNTPPSDADGPIEDEATALDLVTLLLERGADPNIQLKQRPQYRQGVNERGADHVLFTGATPLLRAARSADLEVIRLLLDHGAIVDLPNQFGITPFMTAAGVTFGVRATRGVGVPEAQRIEAMRLLLDAGADINRRVVSQGVIQPPELDNFLYRERITTGNHRYLWSYIPPDGRNAVHGAAMNGWTEVVRFLAENGADLDVTGTDGLSALDLAAGRYEPEILVPPADPFPETMAALEELCAARAGCAFRAPEDSAS